ncbi:MAG: hypothetical protein IJX26_01520, partial [Clostridia bacterium]|nr:hypothetical protein [Clostridia bacterium]
MKHCDVCNIEIADNISHCPLCGKNILKNQEKITNQTFMCYPDNKIWSNNRNMIVNYFFWLLTIGTVICTILELVFFKRYYFSCYVLTGSVFAIFNILLPIKKRWCFSSVSTIVGISICAYLIFIELFTGTFGWGIMYTLPFFLLFMCIYSTSIIWSRNYYKG